MHITVTFNHMVEIQKSIGTPILHGLLSKLVSLTLNHSQYTFVVYII